MSTTSAGLSQLTRVQLNKYYPIALAKTESIRQINKTRSLLLGLLFERLFRQWSKLENYNCNHAEWVGFARAIDREDFYDALFPFTPTMKQ
jgi:hypothetical protein